MTKTQILFEIKRLAAANAGKAPGKRTFFKETGVRESDWSGKYWARWSDAVEEAGLSPNQLQEAYGEDAIIEKVIEFIRELGKFPVTSEIRMKVRQAPGFPNDKTIEKNLGSKAERCRRIADYCRGRKGYEDIVTICEQAGGAASPAGDAREEVLGEEVLGFVYLLKAGKAFKIGRTNSVGRRERELAIQLPERSQTIHEIKTDDPVGIEAYWHNRFRDKRKNGEWFELDVQDVKAFRRRKFM